MNGENINIEPHRLRVLLSPLDWGLGHSTRIITIVKMLQSQGVEVLIAAESASASLLSKEFPEIKIIALKGYRIKYSSAKGDFLLTLVRQLPSVLKTIRYERRWLKEVVETHHIDATISDNRFGFLKSGTPSVYITHQLLIKTGHGWLDRIAQKIHYRYINRFNRCWVPDVEKGPSLAGKLSHPARFPQAEVKYIGPLSRFKKGPLVPIHIDLLVILSGPEPQRTIWEDMLLKQIPNFPYRVTLVRGLPGSNAQLPAAVNLKVYHHLPSTELEQQINKAGI
ncbi:MAG: glycosyl transferase family 28, partial [Gammaproteobacteria bacterium]